MDPFSTLGAFDAYLSERGLRLEAVIVGGAALNLLGLITRPTRDCDVLHPALPAAIAAAARSFAAQMRGRGVDLEDAWLNDGPKSLVPLLPADWASRLTTVFSGRAIELRSLGRPELLASKVFALCDRGIDLQDCIAIAPSAAEPSTLLSWLEYQDTNPDWPAHVRSVVADLARRLGHGV